MTSILPSPGSSVTRAIERLRLPVARKRAPLSILAGARLAASDSASAAAASSASRRARSSSSSASTRARSSALSSRASGSTRIGSRSAPGITSFFFSSAAGSSAGLSAAGASSAVGSSAGASGSSATGSSAAASACGASSACGSSAGVSSTGDSACGSSGASAVDSVFSSGVSGVCSSSGIKLVRLHRFGLLRLVRVLRPGVHLQLGQLLAGEAVAREHPLDRLADHFLGLALEHLGQRPRLDPARVTAVAPVGLLGQLVAGDADLLRVDDDDEVAGVDVRRVLGLTLAAQRIGDLGRQPAQGLALGVDDVPVSLAVLCVGYV